MGGLRHRAVGAGQVRPEQVSGGQVGVGQVRLRQVGQSQQGIAQVSRDQIRAVQALIGTGRRDRLDLMDQKEQDIDRIRPGPRARRSA